MVWPQLEILLHYLQIDALRTRVAAAVLAEERCGRAPDWQAGGGWLDSSRAHQIINMLCVFAESQKEPCRGNVEFWGAKRRARCRGLILLSMS